MTTRDHADPSTTSDRPEAVEAGARHEPPLPERLRRARHLIVWWDEGGLRARNYATGAQGRLRAPELHILQAAERWTGGEALAEALSEWDPEVVRAGAARLWRLGLLEEPARRSRPRERALARWRDWNPEAGFFHLGTRDVPYNDPRNTDRPASRGIRFTLAPPYPGAIKRYPEASRLALPPFRRGGELAEVLLARRTWRRFGGGSLPLQALSDLLGLTWGVQRWIHLADHRAALKTSPSGGARQPIEAYVVAGAVEGLPPGTYHYGPDTHTLAAIGPGVSRTTLEELLGRQQWFAAAPVVVFMTALFSRLQSRYPHPRTYRVVLLEAGHFCQTFCLVATKLGLAPFCTAALADTEIERHLGIDGVSESVLYAAGVGTRPTDTDWAPFPPDEDGRPRTGPPSHAEGRD